MPCIPGKIRRTISCTVSALLVLGVFLMYQIFSSAGMSQFHDTLEYTGQQLLLIFAGVGPWVVYLYVFFTWLGEIVDTFRTEIHSVGIIVPDITVRFLHAFINALCNTPEKKKEPCCCEEKHERDMDWL